MRATLVALIVLAVLLVAWLYRYEPMGSTAPAVLEGGSVASASTAKEK